MSTSKLTNKLSRWEGFFKSDSLVSSHLGELVIGPIGMRVRGGLKRISVFPDSTNTHSQRGCVALGGF